MGKILGLTFSNGVLSGTPKTRGSFPITVTGTDANSCQVSTTYALAISAERRLVVGAGIGGGGIARAFTLASATPVLAADAGTGFNGGVSVAEADVDGNGAADVITGAGPGEAPTVTVFDGTGVATLAFVAFPSTFTGGVEVAAGDVTGDGQPEILAVQGCGSASTPVVRAFDGRTGTIVREYAVSASVSSCGLHVAAGDVSGDGIADLVVGSGGLGPAYVRVIDGWSGALMRESFPYSSAFTGGVYVAAGDVNGDGFADIVTGAGPGGTPHVRVFDGETTSEVFGVFAFDPSFSGGVFVAAPVTSARMAVDIAARTTGTDVRIAGWALRELAADTNGNDAIHAWAYPVAGGAPVFVSAAPARVARPDVAAFFGGEFLMAGFDFSGTLAPGTYDLVIFARNTRTLKFDQVQVIRVTVP